jgi:hypothetical protein
MRLKGADDDEFAIRQHCRRLERRRGPGACRHRRRARVDARPRILFRTIGRGTGKLTRTVLLQANAYAMSRRRAAAAWIAPSSATTASAR